MQEKTKRQVNFYLEEGLAKKLDQYISSKHVNFSSWIRAVVVKNLITEGVLSDDCQVIEPWLSPDSMREGGLRRDRNESTILEENHKNFFLSLTIWTALKHYTYNHPVYKNRTGAISFWILKELVELGQINLKSQLGVKLKNKIAEAA